MIICGCDNGSIEIQLKERLPPGTPRAGDSQLLILVHSQGFSGTAIVWIDAEHFRTFRSELRQLEARREGQVTMESISPEGIRLTISIVNRKGDVAINGRLSVYHFGAEGRQHFHAVEFGFDIDGEMIPGMVTDFAKLASEVP